MKTSDIMRGRDEGRIRRVKRKKFKKRYQWMKYSDFRIRI